MPVTGAKVQLGMDPASTTPTEVYEALITGFDLNEDLYDAAGLRGTRSHIADRVRQNTRAPKLTFTMQPNSVELDTLLPRILGGVESADAFPLAETLPTFVIVLDLNAQRWNLTGCKVSKATFGSSQGGPLNLELEVEAQDLAVVGTNFPALTVSAVAPYLHSDTSTVLNAQNLSYRDVKISIDNVLDTGRFFNSQTRVSFPEKDRIVTWDVNGPYGENTALYGMSAAGVACTATWVLGNRSLQFSSPAVSFPRKPPIISGRDEIMLPTTGIARKTGSSPELAVVNDSTP